MKTSIFILAIATLFTSNNNSLSTANQNVALVNCKKELNAEKQADVVFKTTPNFTLSAPSTTNAVKNGSLPLTADEIQNAELATVENLKKSKSIDYIIAEDNAIIESNIGFVGLTL